jgi:hypothetical protein
MSNDASNVRTDGLWGDIEFEELTQPKGPNQVNHIEAINPSGNKHAVFWDRKGSKLAVRDERNRTVVDFNDEGLNDDEHDARYDFRADLAERDTCGAKDPLKTAAIFDVGGSHPVDW